MSIEWSAINESHVLQACESVAARSRTKDQETGLVVYVGDRCLPAKEVLREAYRLAKRLAPEAEVKFASGEASLNVLRKLGFRAERLTPRASGGADA